VSVLLDSGVSAQYMSGRLARELAIPLVLKKHRDRCQIADGTMIPSDHIATVHHSIGTFSEI
jgi:hypothetical protein